jgi:hypothetical protein
MAARLGVRLRVVFPTWRTCPSGDAFLPIRSFGRGRSARRRRRLLTEVLRGRSDRLTFCWKTCGGRDRRFCGRGHVRPSWRPCPGPGHAGRGHLLHNEPRAPDGGEGIEYIHRVLDAHPGNERKNPRHAHPNQSLTGKFVRGADRAKEHRLEGTYFELLCQAYEYVLGMETSTRPVYRKQAVKGLNARVAPEYLTHEFIAPRTGRSSRRI